METVVIDVFEEAQVSACRLPMFVVYDSPSDFKGMQVARLFDVNVPTKYAIVKEAAADIEKEMKRWGKKRVDRNEMDDPVIKEIWI